MFSLPQRRILTTRASDLHRQSLFSLPEDRILTTLHLPRPGACSRRPSLRLCVSLPAVDPPGHARSHYRHPRAPIPTPSAPRPAPVSGPSSLFCVENRQSGRRGVRGPRRPRRRAQRRARRPFLTYFNRGRNPESSSRSAARILVFFDLYF